MAIWIKKNAKVSHSRGELVSAWQLFWSLKVGETQQMKGTRNMKVADVYLSALRLQDGELLIIATGKADGNAIETPPDAGKSKRCSVVSKSHGFNFEDTHVTGRRRIKRLPA